MRLLNLSNIFVPRELWHGLAQSLGVGGILPAAAQDDLGMYADDKQLRVTVRRSQAVSQDTETVTGSYTSGRITLSPCHSCTPGFLTQVYLHELVHAWLHQYHEHFFITHESCRIAERFAHAAFRKLGGRVGSTGLCFSYELPPRLGTADARLLDPLVHKLRDQVKRRVKTSG